MTEVLESGRYALNQALIVTIEQADAGRRMRVYRSQKPVTITSCVRIGQTWKIGYTLNRRSSYGILTRVPAR